MLLSGAQKRKRANENEQKNLHVESMTRPLTDFFLRTAEKVNPVQSVCQSSETTRELYLLLVSEAGSVVVARPDFHYDVAFSQLKGVEKPIRSVMLHKRLDSLLGLRTEANILRK